VSNFRGGPASGEEYGTGSPGVIAFLFATSYNPIFDSDFEAIEPPALGL